MSDGFWSQTIGTVVSGVIAASALTGVPQPAEKPAPAPDTRVEGRDPLADAVEPFAKKQDQGRQRAEARTVVSAFGRDVSWPQCPTGMGIPTRRTLGKPMPPPGTSYVIIGLTNGPAFYPNPCLREQVDYAKQLHLWTSAYAVVTYPTSAQLQEYGGTGPRDGGTPAGRLFNTGWAQAQLNLGYMRAAGLESPTLWVDVEPVRPPAPWSADVLANRKVLEGSMAAYRKAGLKLGVYSTQFLWQSVVGDVDYGMPEWRAAGPTNKQRALAQCAPGRVIQGGKPVIGQWSDVDVDYNVLCPGPRPIDVLREFFTPL